MTEEITGLVEQLQTALGEEAVHQTFEDGRVIYLARQDYKQIGVESPATHRVELASLASVRPWIEEMLSYRKIRGVRVDVPAWFFWGQETASGKNSRYVLRLVFDSGCWPEVGQAVYIFRPAWLARQWGLEAGFAGQWPQKAFKALLEASAGYLEAADRWLVLATSLRVAQNLEREAVIENSLNYQVAYKIKEAQGSLEIPKSLVLDLELFEGCSAPSRVELLIDLDWPEGQAGRGPVFVARCPTAERIIQEAVRREVEAIAASCGGRVRVFQGNYLG